MCIIIIFNVKKFNNVCEYTDVRGPNYKHLYEFKNGVASGPCPATAAWKLSRLEGLPRLPRGWNLADSWSHLGYEQHSDMPVAREKSARRRAASTSSDCSQGPQLPSPKPPSSVTTDSCTSLDGDYQESARLERREMLPCCSPRGCMLGKIDTHAPEPENVRVVCSNEKCPYSPFMHGECFDLFEEQTLSCLRGMSRARNWTEKQRRQNVWTKKGYDLVYKFCTCACGKGNLRKDINHVIPVAAAVASSIPGAVTVDKRKRRKKSSSLSDKSPRDHAAPRCRSLQKMSDSISSENGTPAGYMQPFSHRTDYSIFDQLVPRHLVNSFHIKMEDDGYAAGDETRSFVLSSLAFHRTSKVTCVLCDDQLDVFDRFPLINGSFYLSPVRPKWSSLEVESKQDEPVFMSAVCLRCMTGSNRVSCSYCSTLWDGNCHQIGTMYTYDLFAATPCCPASVQCTQCRQPVMDVAKNTSSYSQMSAQKECPHCGHKDYHCVKPISRFSVFSQSIFSPPPPPPSVPPQ